MKPRLALIPVRWIGAVWTQPLAGACRLLTSPAAMPGVSLVRRPLRLSAASAFVPTSVPTTTQFLPQ